MLGLDVDRLNGRWNSVRLSWTATEELRIVISRIAYDTNVVCRLKMLTKPYTRRSISSLQSAQFPTLALCDNAFEHNLMQNAH